MNNKIENTDTSQTEKTVDGKSQSNCNEELISEFKNQLTFKEMFKGTFIFINRKLWFLKLIFIVVFVAFGSSDNDYLLALLFSIFFAAIIMDLFLTLTIVLLLFSTSKIATYKLYDNSLEISNNKGITHIYTYNRIRSIDKKNIIVLCFPQFWFAIIAKRHLSPEQMEMLTKNGDN